MGLKNERSLGIFLFCLILKKIAMSREFCCLIQIICGSCSCSRW